MRRACRLSLQQTDRTGFHLSEQSPLEHMTAVSVPTLVAHVHDDTMTRLQDV
jgi:uncharacterized protein